MKKFLSFCASLFLIPAFALASVSFDASTHVDSGSSGSMTVAGDFLTVCAVSTSIDNLTATFDGVSMTKLQTSTPDGGGNRMTLFGLASPHKVNGAISISGSSVSGFSAVSYSGVSNVSGLSYSANTGGSITGTVSVSVDQAWVTSCTFGRFGPHNLTNSTGVTNLRTASSLVSQGDSGPHSVGNINHTWLNSDSSDNTFIGLSLEPTSGGGGSTSTSTATSTSVSVKNIGDVTFGIAIIIVFLSIMLSSLIWNTISDSKREHDSGYPYLK